MEQVQAAPTPATIFSLFYEGKFVTTDISACMDSRFDKTITGNKLIQSQFIQTCLYFFRTTGMFHLRRRIA